MISIVIPFDSHSVNGDIELLWALKSWNKFFTQPYSIHILTDHVPNFSAKEIGIKDSELFIHLIPKKYPEKLKQFYGGGPGERYYLRYADVIHKLLYAINNESISEKFIWSYDDCLLCRKITVDDIKPVALDEGMAEFGARAKGKWGRTINKSLEFGRMYNSNKVYSYETHLPRVFEKSKWKKILKLTGGDLINDYIPYAISTLYFNFYYDSPFDIISYEKNNWKAGFYGRRGMGAHVPSSVEDVKNIVKDKVFINHNDRGLHKKTKEGIVPVYEYLEKEYSGNSPVKNIVKMKPPKTYNKSKEKVKTVISLTTIPSRIDHIGKCIDSLKKQGLPIYIHLPYKLKRKDEVFKPSLPSFLYDDNIFIAWTEDRGSLSKLIPAINRFDRVITADDDIVYPEHWAYDLIEASDKYDNAVIAYRGRIIEQGLSYKKSRVIRNPKNSYKRVNLVTGVFGVCYRKKFFKGFSIGYSIQDDIDISHHLNSKGIQMLVIPYRGEINNTSPGVSYRRNDMLWNINKKQNNVAIHNKYFPNV